MSSKVGETVNGDTPVYIGERSVHTTSNNSVLALSPRACQNTSTVVNSLQPHFNPYQVIFKTSERANLSSFIQPSCHISRILITRKTSAELTRTSLQVLSIARFALYLSICPGNLAAKDCVARPVGELLAFIRSIYIAVLVIISKLERWT